MHGNWLQVTGPRLCPYQPPATTATRYALVLVIAREQCSQQQWPRDGAEGSGQGTSGAVAWDLENPAAAGAAYTLPGASEVVISLHDPRTSWAPLQTFHQAGLPQSEGAVLLYMSAEDAVSNPVVLLPCYNTLALSLDPRAVSRRFAVVHLTSWVLPVHLYCGKVRCSRLQYARSSPVWNMQDRMSRHHSCQPAA